jgi:autotransporter translocation and assembly factor TamB
MKESNKFATFILMRLLLILFLFCGMQTNLQAQVFARSWDTWFGQLQVGATTGIDFGGITSITHRL